MNQPTPQPAQTGALSVVEMAVVVILFLWVASLPSKRAEPHRPARTDHHLSARLRSQLDGWMQTGFRGSAFGAVYHHLHASFAGPE
jgi:hypothetical protein